MLDDLMVTIPYPELVRLMELDIRAKVTAELTEKHNEAVAVLNKQIEDLKEEIETEKGYRMYWYKQYTNLQNKEVNNAENG